uniref:7-dehydrocholesterol reductase n=1 Tax=Pyramimonas obovata TaxID=1411642 RepID=A0A7S0N8U1_9CHLO|mmetsp:Transcript_22126/g.48564  ORF Transcript_22126/g.48564 Transcript_22126/m.48564 type:complete len:469 (+) Transcript_22126:143-1549(+)|eukprot:CAMPEP_0118934496 /NCGR_PEP_ID=MMETSP1169-20130426/13857_1 /TAXON_ID=36882 /ORGANISM="Pyramimonas obovata, Strain CCMP722" /LENGTH=468 /DNA_ID=CAMNT_0006877407 /DNA_START=96 /DNA_END=1502 /DNA_ORIENTATION=+
MASKRRSAPSTTVVEDVAPAKTTASNGWLGDGNGSAVRGDTFLQKTISSLGVVALIVLTPPFIIILWYWHTQLGGDSFAMASLFMEKGLAGLWEIWPAPTPDAWRIIGCFAALEAFLQVTVPGKTFHANVTPCGNIPVYKANGVQCYVLTGIIFVAIWQLGYWNPAEVYDHFGEILAALNICSFAFCFFLVAKGHFAPSSTDNGSSGSPLYDFYWGMELYPRIGPLDLKTFTNCRFGMMAWPYIILCFAIKQQELYGSVADSIVVSIVIMLAYISKFFLWETGYWNSMDIQHDRAGYYLCWGCLCWVPCVYTSPVLYLTTHPVALGPAAALAMTAAGVACVWMNYDSDRQRQVFRATNGEALVWGRKPEYITAKYATTTGKTRTSLLLTSGWWGITRHFHYLPEISASFFWTLPGLFNHAIHYFYVVYLTILLFDRAVRDDHRCEGKYGEYWKQYQAKVPYRVVPGIF